MSSITWTWKSFWDWYIQIEDEKNKSFVLAELTRDGWLERCSSNVQIEVMKYAPEEILNVLHKFPNIFKPETIRSLGNKPTIKKIFLS